jgi:hypothetical protein
MSINVETFAKDTRGSGFHPESDCPVCFVGSAEKYARRGHCGSSNHDAVLSSLRPEPNDWLAGRGPFVRLDESEHRKGRKLVNAIGITLGVDYNVAGAIGYGGSRSPKHSVFLAVDPQGRVLGAVVVLDGRLGTPSGRAGGPCVAAPGSSCRAGRAVPRFRGVALHGAAGPVARVCRSRCQSPCAYFCHPVAVWP